MPIDIAILNNIVSDAEKAAAGITQISKEKISQFIATTINGDEYISHVSFRAQLSKDREGLLVYILTSAKVVKIEIDKADTQAFTFYLKDLVGVTRSIANDQSGTNQTIFEFKQGSFGLRYFSDMKWLEDFFSRTEALAEKTKGN